MNESGARIVVHGIVQGVGYRYFCYREAEAIGLKGSAENRVDGTVYLEVEGPRQLIEQFIARLRVGPPSSRVSSVTVNWIKQSGNYTSFQITG